MKKTLIALSIISFFACKQQEKKESTLVYPTTKKVAVEEDYFGTKVVDNYRWLEDDLSEETEAWVKSQNEVTFSYLAKIPYREQLKKSMLDLNSYEKIGAPSKEGKYIYYAKNSGLQNHWVHYRKDEAGNEELFIDPNTFSKDGTTALAGMTFTKDGSMVVLYIQEAGADWKSMVVLDTETKEVIGDTIKDIKFSGASWIGNKGFYYSTYQKPEGSNLTAKTDQHIIYYHELNTPQSEDKIIYGAKPEEKHRYAGAYVTEDQNYLVITLQNSTYGNKLLIKELSNKEAGLITVLDHFDSETYVVENEGSKLYISTDLDAPNKRLVSTDISNPGSENWVDVIPETENVLEIGTGGGYFFGKYTEAAITKVKQFDYDGGLVREIELPGIGTAEGFGCKKEEKELYYTFSNYITPKSYYKYSLETGESELYWKPEINFNSDDYESKQVFYTSKDGTKIPMIINYKKGIELNGKNPTLLYGYGGFNIMVTPSFKSSNAVWMENGGIYAVANLRGGGEYGKKWHIAGTQQQKQNVFDDFIAAGEYLIQEKYTSTDYLAIHGRSNGGLLVGATMLQRPDLFKVALPGVGVLDMLRYHKFTAGAGWAYDYGTADDNKEMFEYLYRYSPVHNVKENVEYPAVMITTGDHDDRVVPAHSFKFAAELQAKQFGNNPRLIRIETNAGHGSGKPLDKQIEERADMFAFALYNMGVESLSVSE